MRRKAHKVHTHLAHVYLDLADGLRRVGVKQRAVFVSDRRALFNRENSTRFVICPHDANERGFVVDELS